MKQVISSFWCLFLLCAFLVLDFMVKVSGNQEGGFLLLFNAVSVLVVAFLLYFFWLIC